MADYRRINVLMKHFQRSKGYFNLFCNLLAGGLLLLVFTATTSAASPEQSRKVQRFFSGTNQEVIVYTIHGENPGPTLLVFAGIHGDERTCSLVAAKYSHVKLKTGNLIIVPRLNKIALQKNKRYGLGGDMNRLFDQPGNSKNHDMKVVNLAKTLIKKADYVVNVHRGYGFYSSTWVDSRRNPSRWGQSNVIDAPNFDLPNGEKLELEKFAERVAQKTNAQIKNVEFHFQVNNTNTGSEDSAHKEQRKSLTYYAVTKEHKVAIALEATKNCTSAQATSFLMTAINAVIEEIGIVPDKLTLDRRPPPGKKPGKL